MLLLCCITITSSAQSLYTNATNKLNSTALGASSMDVVVADINGDSNKDIIVAIEFGQNRILFGDGQGNYNDQSDGRFVKANHDSEDIGVADFDGNGWLDIVIVSEDDSVHELYLNTSGTFTDVSNRLPKSKANAVLCADINNDTYIDIIIGNNGQNDIYINDGNASFTKETAARLPTINDVTQDLLLVDVDNDSDPDLIAGNEDTNRILLNNGSGVFTDVTATYFPTGLNVETRKVATTDINNDGFADLYFANVEFISGKDRQDRIFINDKSGKFVDETSLRLPVDTKHTPDIVFNDVDMDGDKDIITTYFPTSPPRVFINDGNGNFSYKSNIFPLGTFIQGITVVATDLNGDGMDDIYFGGFMDGDMMLFKRQFPQNLQQTENNVQVSINQVTGENSLLLSNESNYDLNVQISLLSLDGRLLRAPKELVLIKHKYTEYHLDELPKGIYLVYLKGKKIDIKKQVIVI